MSNGKSIPRKSSRQGSGTATLMTHPSSPIYLPSGVNSLEEWLTSLQQDSRVNPIQLQDSSEEPVMTGTSGLTRSELSVKWDHDTSSWKTCQVSFLHLLTGEDQRMGEPWLESLPKSGTVSTGKQSELTMWAHPTGENDGGALGWPTPTMRIWKGSGPTVIRKDGKSRMDQLDYVAEQSQPGPQVPQIQTHGSESSENVQTSPQPSTKRLNPSFVEWLMGLPIGWTSLQPMTELTD